MTTNARVVITIYDAPDESDPNRSLVNVEMDAFPPINGRMIKNRDLTTAQLIGLHAMANIKETMSKFKDAQITTTVDAYPTTHRGDGDVD